MKNLFAILCICVSIHTYSQTIKSEGVFAAAGNLSNSYAQISWTLGDFQTTTYSIDNLVLTQGFLQSSITIINVVNVKEDSPINLKVFPNPISDYLNISYSAEKETSITFYLYTLNGRLVNLNKTTAKDYSETINFRQFESGTYILKAVSGDDKFEKTFKLLYQN